MLMPATVLGLEEGEGVGQRDHLDVRHHLGRDVQKRPAEQAARPHL
jgi:hypothetical protein